MLQKVHSEENTREISTTTPTTADTSPLDNSATPTGAVNGFLISFVVVVDAMLLSLYIVST